MFNFHFGKPSKKTLITLSIIISSIIAALSQCTGINENNLWDLLDEVQRKYFPQTGLNRIIVDDPDKIKRRVERDVSRAIDEAIPEYNRFIQEADKKYQPKYLEGINDESVCYTDDCKSLSPPMRICAPWIIDCN